MKPLIFENNYVRDTTILIQQIWAQELSTGLAERKGWKNPYLPMIIHYMRHGTVEIWDNALARRWYMAKLLEENIKDESIMMKSLSDYKEQLAKLKPYWKLGAAESQKEFDDYLKLLPVLMFNFNLWYYTVTDERTPKHLVDIILDIRKDDTFFASNDVYIGNTLRKLHPEIAGCENAVLFEEVQNIPDRKILEARLKGSALIDGSELFIGEPDVFAEKYPMYDLQIAHVGENITSVKGQVAYKGKVKGTVRILRRRDQVSSVKPGDIIVSPMTTPDFLPAMNNAAAFVTDEGGITCHAAIVAREMKKPCIIGTKIATRIFNDGDMVEVDANTGVVSIIK